MAFDVPSGPSSGSLADGEGDLRVKGPEDIEGAVICDPEWYAGSLPLRLGFLENFARGVAILEIREGSEAWT